MYSLWSTLKTVKRQNISVMEFVVCSQLNFNFVGLFTSDEYNNYSLWGCSQAFYLHKGGCDCCVFVADSINTC